jgi:hypothetical protein
MALRADYGRVLSTDGCDGCNFCVELVETECTLKLPFVYGFGTYIHPLRTLSVGERGSEPSESHVSMPEESTIHNMAMLLAFDVPTTRSMP